MNEPPGEREQPTDDTANQPEAAFANIGIEKIERDSEKGPLDIDVLVTIYRNLHPEAPIWMLVSDIQRQAFLYWNVLERVKSGDQAPALRARFEDLGLMPTGILPNPAVMPLLQKAFDKLTTFRRALVDLVRRFGGELLSELGFEFGLTVNVGVSIGFPPAVTIAIEHASTATTTVDTRYGARREPPG